MLGTAESLGVAPTGQKELKTKIKTVVEIFAEKNKSLVENAAKSLQGLKELVPDLPNLLQDINTRKFVILAILGLCTMMVACAPVAEPPPPTPKPPETFYCPDPLLEMDEKTVTMGEDAPVTTGELYTDLGGGITWKDGAWVPLEGRKMPVSFEKESPYNLTNKITIHVIEALCGEEIAFPQAPFLEVKNAHEAEVAAQEQAEYEASQYNYKVEVQSGDSVGMIYQRLMDQHGFEYDEGDRITIYDAHGNRITGASLIDFNQNLVSGHIEEGWTVEVDSRNVP